MGIEEVGHIVDFFADGHVARLGGVVLLDLGRGQGGQRSAGHLREHGGGMMRWSFWYFGLSRCGCGDW